MKKESALLRGIRDMGTQSEKAAATPEDLYKLANNKPLNPVTPHPVASYLKKQAVRAGEAAVVAAGAGLGWKKFNP
jgi:hypothetical protein